MIGRPLPISVIVFDLDDTLYLERDFVSSGFAAVGAWLHTNHGVVGFAARAEAAFARGERTRVFNHVLADIGLSPAMAPELVEVYRAHRPVISLASDAAACIARHRGSCDLALVTDGHLQTQRNKIEVLGLAAAGIETIICTDSWGRGFWKPHRRSFDHIQAKFGRPGTSFIYVADNPAKDFIAPRALGWHTAQIIRQGGIHPCDAPGSVPADIELLSLDDLDDALAELAARVPVTRAPAHAAG